MNHESMSAISGFQAKSARVIHQFGNEFLLNRMRFKRKQAHPHRANSLLAQIP